MYQAPEVGFNLSEEEFQLLLMEQLKEIEQAFSTMLKRLIEERPQVYTSAPTAPYDGLIAIADGTGWNPGSGAGYYGYYASAWHFLG